MYAKTICLPHLIIDVTQAPEKKAVLIEVRGPRGGKRVHSFATRQEAIALANALITAASIGAP